MAEDTENEAVVTADESKHEDIESSKKAVKENHALKKAANHGSNDNGNGATEKTNGHHDNDDETSDRDEQSKDYSDNYEE